MHYVFLSRQLYFNATYLNPPMTRNYGWWKIWSGQVVKNLHFSLVRCSPPAVNCFFFFFCFLSILQGVLTFGSKLGIWWENVVGSDFIGDRSTWIYVYPPGAIDFRDSNLQSKRPNKPVIHPPPQGTETWSQREGPGSPIYCSYHPLIVNTPSFFLIYL